MTTATETFVTLPKNSNQALGIGIFAIDFMNKSIGEPSKTVLDRSILAEFPTHQTKLFS